MQWRNVSFFLLSLRFATFRGMFLLMIDILLCMSNESFQTHPVKKRASTCSCTQSEAVLKLQLLRQHVSKTQQYSRQEEGEKKERRKERREEKKELVPSDHKNDIAHKQQLRYARKKRSWLSARARTHTHTHTHIHTHTHTYTHTHTHIHTHTHTHTHARTKHTHTCINGGERVKESPCPPRAKSILNIKQDCLVIAYHTHTHARTCIKGGKSVKESLSPVLADEFNPL